MALTAPERTLSAAQFQAIRTRSLVSASPIVRARTTTRCFYDVEMLIRDRDLLLAELAAEVARHNGLTERLRTVCPDTAPAPLTLDPDEQPAPGAQPRSFDTLSHRAVLAILARDIADATVYGDEGLTDPMRDRGALLAARPGTLRSLLAAQEATIALFHACAAHGLEVTA